MAPTRPTDGKQAAVGPMTIDSAAGGRPGGRIKNADNERLKSGQLGTGDLTLSTVANIGPGIDFYFAFGVIAVTAGVAAPLTILAAGVAVVLLAWTVAEFTRAEPSAGSFITYVETSLGARAGVVTALLVTAGYTIAMAGVFTMAGGMVTMTLAHYFSWNVPWGPLTLALTAGAIWLTARGVRISTTAVGVAVLTQVGVMVAVCIVVLVDQRSHLSSAPFSWSHLTGGLTGLSAGFPLALYMFIGWENGPALAEECRNPRRTVPRALFLSVAIGAVLFIGFAYATVTGFHYDVSSIGRSSVPFLTVADHYLGGAAVLAWIAGTVSVLAALVAGTSSQARMLYDGGRSGLLPAPLGRLHPKAETPVNALLTMASHRPGHHRRLGRRPCPRCRHRLDGPRRPVRRVLDHGHDRDLDRLRLDRRLAARVHVAAAPKLLLAGPAHRAPGSWGSSPWPSPSSSCASRASPHRTRPFRSSPSAWSPSRQCWPGSPSGAIRPPARAREPRRQPLSKAWPADRGPSACGYGHVPVIARSRATRAA